MARNQPYRPLVEEEEADNDDEHNREAGKPSLSGYSVLPVSSGRCGTLLRTVFCCCGKCERLPCCPALKGSGSRLKEFLFQNSSVCQAAWLSVFLLLVVVFAILMATVVAQADNPYNTV